MSVVQTLAARLVAVSLVVAIVAATVFAKCDFDNGPCDGAMVVAETQVNPGIIADRTTPERTKDDGDGAAASGGADGHSGAWLVPNLPSPAALDQLPGVASYPSRAAADPGSLAGNPPGHPPKA